MIRVGEAVSEINPWVFSFPASTMSEKECQKSTLNIVAAIQKISAVLKVTSNFGCVVTLTQQDDGIIKPLFCPPLLNQSANKYHHNIIKTTTSVVIFSVGLSEELNIQRLPIPTRVAPT
ncbi:unnamed protein product [Lactuca saligna]|uniref:Uncharacterized protein n=1 Tax=Lactuca saligna TaxID=75948 RepID=A0AA35YA96_LACSI|nr:unnamed protein product [Lactuca saligna]